ncbi:hypothetical protein RB195_014262 [Necator americanus]|uniref:Reverse transcriptase domain-containing protein n=1 Tax=Necator americanus TaxID=51031 RepID=A0ABR1DZC1_NECAM
MEKNICYRQRRRKEVLYDDCVLEDSLSQGDWHFEEDLNVDCEMLLRGLGACAERRRRALRLDPNASHIERQKKILEAAQRRTSLKKCRRDLREYNIQLATLLSEDGTRTSSRREMEIITERTLDEAQPQEQAGFRQGLSCLDHIHTVSRVIEVCREYRLPLVLTFVDYEKAFDNVETNAILSALVDQGVDVSYKAHCEDGGVQLEGSQIVETPSYEYLGRSMNMENDLKEELNRRMRAAWAAFVAVREATDQLTDQDLRAHLFDSAVLSALCYAAETWADIATTPRKLFTPHRALERCFLKFNRRTQHLAGLRSSDLRGMSRLRDPAEYVSKANHRWAGHIMRRIANEMGDLLEASCSLVQLFGFSAYHNSANYSEPTDFFKHKLHVENLATQYDSIYMHCPSVNATTSSCALQYNLCENTPVECAERLCRCINDATTVDENSSCHEVVDATCTTVISDAKSWRNVLRNTQFLRSNMLVGLHNSCAII